MDEDDPMNQNGDDNLRDGTDMQDGQERAEALFARADPSEGGGSIPLEQPKEESPDEEPSKNKPAPAGIAFDESQVDIERDGSETYHELRGFISEKRKLRILKVVTLVGPGSAGKTFLLLRLNDLMKKHVLYGFHGNDLLKKHFDYVDRSNKICGYYYESSEQNAGGVDYLVIDCPGERYNSFIDHLTQSAAQRANATETPPDIANIAACLYWTDAIALALPAMPVLDAGNYEQAGDSLTFESADRLESIQKARTLVRNFMRFRQCISEIHAVRRRMGGLHQNGLQELHKLLAQYVVNDKDAAGLSDIPIKLMLTQADEMIEFGAFGADCDAAIIPLIEQQRKNDGQLTTTLANQFTFASWDFITAFDMPDKATKRQEKVPNPQTPQYDTAHYGLVDLLPRWLDDHPPLPLLIRPDNTDNRRGSLQWRWRQARTGLRPLLLEAGKLLGWPLHVASKDLLPLALKKRV